MTVDDGAAVAVLGLFGAGLGHVLAPAAKAFLAGITGKRSTPPPPPPRCSPSVEDKVDELHTILAQRSHTGASTVLECLAELPKIRELLQQLADRPRPPFRSTPAE